VAVARGEYRAFYDHRRDGRDGVYAGGIRERVPAPLKSFIRAALNPPERLRRYQEARRRSRRFHALVSELRAGAEPSLQTYAELVRAWGNEDYVAPPEYLAAIAPAIGATPGPVLECGSGLSTIVLAIEGERYGVDVYALEHDPAWAARMRAELERLRLTRTRVLRSRLQSYGEFAWYAVPDELPHSFSFVVCDGPPANLCGRYGLLPVLGERIHGEILLDDATRAHEEWVISTWVARFGVSALVEPARNPYARVRLPGPSGS
jgi:hypothetical protein